MPLLEHHELDLELLLVALAEGDLLLGLLVGVVRSLVPHAANTAVASMMGRACTSAQQVSVAERVCDSWMHGNPRVAKISCMELGRMLTCSGINTG